MLRVLRRKKNNSLYFDKKTESKFAHQNLAPMTKEKKKTEKKPSERPAAPIRKKDPKKKIELGTGRHLGYVSDTLFDDDLER